jgi:four helix bundle protein
MDKRNLQSRIKNFAHRCIQLATEMPRTLVGRHISNQLIRCSTSVAANDRASCIAQTKRGFVAKLSVVGEEVDESAFWLEFLTDEGLIKTHRVEPLLKEADELTAIFMASRKTARSRA